MYLIYALHSYTIALASFPGLHPSTRAVVDSSYMYAVTYLDDLSILLEIISRHS